MIKDIYKNIVYSSEYMQEKAKEVDEYIDRVLNNDRHSSVSYTHLDVYKRQLVLSPFIPIYWTLDRPCNYIEIPDYDMEFAMMHNVEHGSFTREIDVYKRQHHHMSMDIRICCSWIFLFC